jgi:hypothetical protein
VDHSLDADYVEVSIEHERRRIVRADARNNVGTARRRIDQLNGKAPIFENRGQGVGAITLAR